MMKPTARMKDTFGSQMEIFLHGHGSFQLGRIQVKSALKSCKHLHLWKYLIRDRRGNKIDPNKRR